ncbi:MAG: Replication initiation and membrane attachment [Firmicutes bacterium ADurb.Bin193]|nr:MAG: Replication initiation and membrane attachment [Firmicutes bacterium ADurb.Bin193]
MDNISLPVKFIDEYLPKAEPAYVVVYLYAYRFISRNEVVPDTRQIASALNLKERQVEAAMDYWNRYGFNLGGRNVIKTLHKSIYTPSEIAARAQTDKKLKWLYEEAQNSLGKILSSADIQALFWIYDYLGLNPQVIMLIINYAKKIDKASMRYIEKIAMDWADKGVDTVRKAERYLADLDEKSTYQYHIKKLFGIKDRDFTPSEKAILDEWATSIKPTDELLLSAFDININRTGNLNIKYINGILKSWKEKGITTTGQIPLETKSTGTANFDQRGDIDFDAREIEILKKRMGR